MRRRFPSILILTLVIASTILVSAQSHSLIQIDRRNQLARADLDYNSPAERPEEGMPIGNGRMGSLVWTTPSAIKFQINRVDVHAMDSTTFSFPRADSDYGYGCGFVDINVVQAGEDAFAGKDFRQHLSLYDALMSIDGGGVNVRLVAWPDRDVFAVEIDDQRSRPEPIDVDLRMLRYQSQYVPGKTRDLAVNHSVVVRTAAHTATSTLGIDRGRITLSQEFQEADFHDSSAVAVAVVGRESRARYLNQADVQLSAAAGRGRFTVLIASAAAADRSVDVVSKALGAIDAAQARGFEALQEDTARSWREFWLRSAVYLHNASGQADFVEANYDYYQYLMGASSRGDFPPRFGGMVWQTDGDMSRWGSQYWWANTSAYYNNLVPSNRVELLDPMFRMYLGMFSAAATAAKQQWGSEGIWIPETTFFNGPERLPDDVAADLREMMLARKPFSERSAAFDEFAANKNRHNSRWNYRADGTWDKGTYVFESKGTGIFGHTSHILGVAARVGAMGWQRFQFTGDVAWFREYGYPFVRGAAEFYRTFPNLQKDDGGVYHINHTNSGESSWNSRDAAYEVSCMHMIFPLAVRASEVLSVDEELRAKWREVKDHLVPAPERSRCGTGSEIADGRPYGAFVYEGPGAIVPDGPQSDLKQRFLGFTRLGSFIDASGGGGVRIFRNRLRLREGPGAIDAEHIAGLSTGLHASLLNSHPESLTNEEPIAIFNDWPKDWDAAFTLLARGGFIVSAAQQGGTVSLVEVMSQNGGEFRLANPWRSGAVTVYREGRKAEDLAGPVVTVKTTKREHVAIAPRGAAPRPMAFPAR
jgi:Glycosyl hydrolase family 95 catalytic domain/Domain of unknown function (DUF5703)